MRNCFFCGTIISKNRFGNEGSMDEKKENNNRDRTCFGTDIVPVFETAKRKGKYEKRKRNLAGYGTDRCGRGQ